MEGPKEKLDSTAISQPAIYVASLAAVEKLRATEGQVGCCVLALAGATEAKVSSCVAGLGLAGAPRVRWAVV